MDPDDYFDCIGRTRLSHGNRQIPGNDLRKIFLNTVNSEKIAFF